MSSLSNNEELIRNEIQKYGKAGILEQVLIKNFENELSSTTIKRILKKLEKLFFITKKRFGQQMKLFSNPELPRGKPYPIINENIYQSFLVQEKNYDLNQIIDLHNLTLQTQQFPEGVYIDRCYPLPSKPKITIDDSAAKYDILETAPNEIRFKIRGEIAPGGFCKRSDKMRFNIDYYHLLHIERPTNYISIKIQYKNKTPPVKYPLCEEWIDSKITNTFAFVQISKNYFQLEIKKPAYPIAHYKTLFFPRPKDR